MAAHPKMAFYKMSKKPWTLEEWQMIVDYCEAEKRIIPPSYLHSDNKRLKYIFDTESGATWMRPESSVWDSSGFKACTRYCFEEFFGTLKLKIYKVADYGRT